MKKIIPFILLVFISIAVFAQNGIMRELSGTVEIKRPGAASFTAARAGDSITRDTIISTGFKSTALVEVGSAVLTVRALTRLALTEIAAASGTETLNVDLQAGRVRVDVNPPSGTRAQATITSPVATASVRGTSFEVDTKSVRVTSGSVSFSGNRGKPAVVNAGSNSRVEADGKPADPVRTKAARLRAPSPPGTDPSSGAGGDSGGVSGGMIGISLNYHGHYDPK